MSLSHVPGDFMNSTFYVDSDSPQIGAFVEKALSGLPGNVNDVQRAIHLFNAVRDGLRYDPYSFSSEASSYKASVIAGMDSAFCVPKAILLAAALRRSGIPAALGFSDVRNHLSTSRLEEMMGTDLFIWHGYVKVWLDGKSFKITPAFNSELCKKFGIKPLVFDGLGDALFHEFDVHENRHMEYVHDRGLYLDFPAEKFLSDFRETYPRLVELSLARESREAASLDSKFN